MKVHNAHGAVSVWVVRTEPYLSGEQGVRSENGNDDNQQLCSYVFSLRWADKWDRYVLMGQWGTWSEIGRDTWDKRRTLGNFLVVRKLGQWASTARATGSIPGGGIKILHAMWQKIKRSFGERVQCIWGTWVWRCLGVTYMHMFAARDSSWTRDKERKIFQIKEIEKLKS